MPTARGAIPSPARSVQDLDPSPRLPSSLTRPSSATGRVPVPPGGSGSTTSSWTIMPAFQTANLTSPDAITEGLVATLIM